MFSYRFGFPRREPSVLQIEGCRNHFCIRSNLTILLSLVLLPVLLLFIVLLPGGCLPVKLKMESITSIILKFIQNFLLLILCFKHLSPG